MNIFQIVRELIWNKIDKIKKTKFVDNNNYHQILVPRSTHLEKKFYHEYINKYPTLQNQFKFSISLQQFITEKKNAWKLENKIFVYIQIYMTVKVGVWTEFKMKVYSSGYWPIWFRSSWCVYDMGSNGRRCTSGKTATKKGSIAKEGIQWSYLPLSPAIKRKNYQNE